MDIQGGRHVGGAGYTGEEVGGRGGGGHGGTVKEVGLRIEGVEEMEGGREVEWIEGVEGVKDVYRVEGVNWASENTFFCQGPTHKTKHHRINL